MEPEVVQQILDKIKTKAFIQDDKLRTPAELDLQIPIKPITSGKLTIRNDLVVAVFKYVSEDSIANIEVRKSGEINIQKI